MKPAETTSGVGKSAILWLIAFIVLLNAGLAVRWFSQRRAPEKPSFVREFMIFHTYGRITFWEPEEKAAAAAEAIIAELQDLEKVINTYDPESEISRLNATAWQTPFICSDALWNIIDAGRKAFADSDGAFDISVGPLMKLWGFYGKRQTLPSDGEITAAMALTGLDKVDMDPAAKSVRFSKPGMFLDFGGIAKGYALDLCVEIADKHGCDTGMIDLGGNIACLSNAPPGRDTYHVGIRNPGATDEVIEMIPMLNQCIATSGNYERFFILDGTFVHHIVDPATGWPVPARASVTVVAPQGLTTDVFSTAIFVRGDAMAERLVDREPSARIQIVTANAEGAPEPMTIRRLNWPGVRGESDAN